MEFCRGSNRRHGRRFTALMGCVALAACCSAMLTLSASAEAAGEFEPNDSRDTAHGPLAGGKAYTGTFETGNDVDWYVFYIKTYSQMDFSSTGVGSDCPHYSASLRLLDRDGKYVGAFDPGKDGETNHLYLTLEPGRYYLEVDDGYYGACTGDAYRFRIDPVTAVTTSRECGEAIVARDAVVPLLAKADENLAANAKVLGKAKRDTRRAGRKLRRLKRRRAARSWFRSARRQFRRAKKNRNQLRFVRRDKLGALKRQHKQALARLDEQIKTFC